MKKMEVWQLYHRFERLSSLLAAQAWVESRWYPTMSTSSGAVGLAQFMPSTWEECIKKGWIPPGAQRTDPEASAAAQKAYLVHLKESFRLSMREALWAYNWGIGNILKIREESPDNWHAKVPASVRAYANDVFLISELLLEFLLEEERLKEKEI